MALADIIGRIESDAGAESRAILDAAKQRAEALVAQAETSSAREAAERLVAAEREAQAQAETLRANARLAARDEALVAKRALIDRVLAAAEERIAALPAERYVALIAAGVAGQARGGETVRIASGDAKRLAGLAGAVGAAAGRDLGLVFSDDPAPIDHGVLIEGDRVRSEVSPQSLLDAKRDHAMTLAASVLFAESKEA